MMVWKVATPTHQSSRTRPQIMESQSRQTDPEGVLTAACDERLSPPASNASMEYNDLPDLQEVPKTEPTVVYQVEVGVSHQERHPKTCNLKAPDTQWLTQLAHIATGPQSPLLQDPRQACSSSAASLNIGCDLHSYARPPPLSERTLSPSRGRGRERHHSRTSSECDSVVSTRSSLSDDEDMTWSVSWPPTAWHCFLKGTRLRFHSGSNVEWQEVEDLDSAAVHSDDMGRSSSLKSYGSEGLQLVKQTENVMSGQAVLQLTFDPGAFGHSHMTVQCQLDHPFYVKDKGWSSFYPSLTVVHYGIPCYEMGLGDVCLPPGHRDAKHTDDSRVFDTFRSYDFTPLDSSAVYVLSSMARRRRASQSSGGAVSPDRDTSRTTPDARSRSPSHHTERKLVRSHPESADESPIKCKRPMNAFMLFAKKFRVEFTRMYPGKDNRAISVLLGEQWKKMRSDERRVFTVRAKALADEQRKLNPDCWKRKRTNSGSQGF
ncbi:HMG box-containing protein 1-like [Synchiropus splendidus]|uniref:HMG box-containing protein 1-like n=1 Tax=Synchiropus splendidus TaxID=270530 RepID=UPI00237EE650|nr:HMG box-containing protein 1-like [Synchiropus splendidus]XP_053717935.1 HMG box-containing protein 1-like [Synchiropus splendidus]